ncbi:MAG: hypothetical protein QME79_04595 [Bacillota bacterium]|nr:hypothetical protein [Bacillota bacterium]
MKPRFLVTCLLALVLGVAAVAPAAAETSVSVTVTTSDPKTMAGLLIGGIMASFFNAQAGAGASAPQPTQTQVIVETAPRPRDPWADLPVWYVASYADVPVEKIIALRRAGKRWVEIVEYYRLPEEFRGRTVIVEEKPSGKVKVKVKKGRPVFVAYSDEEFERFVFIRFIEEYYAVPRATIVVWLDQGLSLHDIFLSVNLATRVRVRPDVIIKYRLRGEPWEAIARRYRITVVELGRPVIIEQKKHRHRVRFEHWGGDDD